MPDNVVQNSLQTVEKLSEKKQYVLDEYSRQLVRGMLNY